MDNNTLIVSVTTWTDRIKNAHLAINSVCESSIGLDVHLVIVLSKEELTENDITDELKELISYYNIEIIWDDGNIKSHKKLIPTIEKYPNNPILIYDDDKYYSNDFVSKFLETHKKYPNDVIVGGGFLDFIPYKGYVKVLNNGFPNNYHKSEEELFISNPANGCYGMLYPAHTFNDKRFFDRNLINELSLNSDEDWQLLFNILEDKTLREVKNAQVEPYWGTENEQKSPLYKTNTFEEYEKRQNLFTHEFPEYYPKLLKRLEEQHKRFINVAVYDENSLNHFDSSLYRELKEKYNVNIYIFNNWDIVFNQFNGSNFFDFIHIQWIESFGNKKDLYNKLVTLRKNGTKVITTVHNTTPFRNKNLKPVYNIVYENTDVFIHMGTYSKKMFESKYPNARHVLIRHHTYDNMLRIENKTTALRNIGLTDKHKNILVFGNDRNKEEEDLLLYVSKFKNYNFIAPRYNLNIDNIFDNMGFVNVETMINMFSACDYVFVNHIKNLNSGIVPMAMYFGKPIIGPNIGNIKEQLEITGNYIFDVDDYSTIDDIFNKLSDKDQEIGIRNKQYANNQLSVDKIAKQVYDLYKELK